MLGGRERATLHCNCSEPALHSLTSLHFNLLNHAALEGQFYSWVTNAPDFDRKGLPTLINDREVMRASLHREIEATLRPPCRNNCVTKPVATLQTSSVRCFANYWFS
jgi:hypothetical protein